MRSTRAVFLFVALTGIAATQAIPAVGQPGQGDPVVLATMARINQQLASLHLHVAVEQIEFYTVGLGRPFNKIHQEGFRWVANDSRRNADGTNITYLVDQSDGATASGLTNAQTEAAIDRALGTWQADHAVKKLAIVKRPDTGADPDVFDFVLGFGSLGNPFLADVVEAGWLPGAFFDAIGGPGGAHGILAVTISAIFTDDNGNPTDINGDNFFDTAFAEVYYNDNFGNPTGSRPGFPWGINVALPGIDVETVALHENGHSLGIDHFGPPPDAVMNPVYAGLRHTILPPDHAGMATVWGSWPK